MEDFTHKVKNLAKKRGVTVQKLAESVDMSEPGFYRMLRNDSTKVNTLLKICTVLKVSPTYFLGSNLGSSELNEGIPEYGIKNNLKYLPLNLQSGDKTVSFEDKNLEKLVTVFLPGFEDCDLLLNVTGDNMLGTFNNGDMVACKKVENLDLLRWGEPYLILTKETALIKRIEKHEKATKLVLTSDNHAYDNIDIKKSEIKALWWIKGYVSMNTGKNK